MFERFTDRAREAVVRAQEEARGLGHDYIGTEHFLLSLMRMPETVAMKVLESLGASADQMRELVVEIIGTTEKRHTGHLPFTPRSKKVLELALRESLRLGHDYIGTEHILLGLIREADGVAAQVLMRQGVEHSQLRLEVIGFLAGTYEQPGYESRPYAELSGPELYRQYLERDIAREWLTVSVAKHERTVNHLVQDNPREARVIALIRQAQTLHEQALVELVAIDQK